MKTFPGHPQKLLVRSTNWIGDAIMTTPAVRTIRENYPKAEITLLALPWVSDVFAAGPRVDRIFHYEKTGCHKGLKGKWKLASELRAEKFDAVILLQNAFEAALITTLAGIPARGGYTTDGRGLLLTHGIKKHPEIGLKHQVHYYLDMLVGLGLTPGSDQLELFLDPNAVGFVVSELRNAKKIHGDVPVIGLNPGAAYGPAKRWPAEKYGELAERLCTQSGAIVLVFGTGDDREAAAAITASASDDARVVDLTGKTNLATAMAYIGQCDAFVTNDSGLMHVAAALQTPTVAIFGSTDHIATGPYSDNAQVLRKPMECSPCMQTHCKKNNFLCMEQIQPDEVFSAVHTIIR